MNVTANVPAGNALERLPEITDPCFHPSPTKLVRFTDGKVIAMNRKQRRANHFYGTRRGKDV